MMIDWPVAIVFTMLAYLVGITTAMKTLLTMGKVRRVPRDFAWILSDRPQSHVDMIRIAGIAVVSLLMGTILLVLMISKRLQEIGRP